MPFSSGITKKSLHACIEQQKGKQISTGTNDVH